MLERIKENLSHNLFTEIIVVDDSSPDGTGNIVENYIINEKGYKKKTKSFKENCNYSIHVLNRKEKNGLIPAILEGVKYSQGDYIIIMDADFSHPPEIIPQMV
ncbi:MAG TPA: glycosyltransferase, partial [Nitrososphaeraceae archaeon]